MVFYIILKRKNNHKHKPDSWIHAWVMAILVIFANIFQHTSCVCVFFYLLQSEDIWTGFHNLKGLFED